MHKKEKKRAHVHKLLGCLTPWNRAWPPVFLAMLVSTPADPATARCHAYACGSVSPQWPAETSIWVVIIDHQTRPLGHLTEVAVSVIKVLDRVQPSGRAKGEWLLQARLVAENARQDCNVVGFVEDCGGVAIGEVPVLSCHVTQHLSSVHVPQLLPDGIGRVVVRRDDEWGDGGVVHRNVLEADLLANQMSLDLTHAGCTPFAR
mmetsp:Transcript_64652/g.127774  ORF Transcript_64652/g.127774 Transcript_64652/m.127774 type:complete len:204 (+) Transcript_64652:241-852(+)